MYNVTSLAARSGVQEWEERAQALLRQVESVLDLTMGPYRIWQRNDMDVFIAATSPGAVVESGALLREEALIIHQLFLAVLAFVNTPIEVYRDAQDQPVLMTPEEIIGYRRFPGEAPLGGGESPTSMRYLGQPASTLVSSLPVSASGRAAFAQRKSRE